MSGVLEKIAAIEGEVWLNVKMSVLYSGKSL